MRDNTTRSADDYAIGAGYSFRFDPTTAGNIKPGKQKSTEKIDGVVATIMTLD